MNACLTLMFSFVQPARTGFLLGVWGRAMPIPAAWPPSVEACCSPCSKPGTVVMCSLPMAAGVFGLQMCCFLGAALMTRRLDVVGFRNTVKTRFADVMEIAVD